MYVCMHVCMCVCIYRRLLSSDKRCRLLCVITLLLLRERKIINIFMRIHAYMHVSMYVCIYVYMYISMHVCMYKPLLSSDYTTLSSAMGDDSSAAAGENVNKDFHTYARM